MPSAASRRPVRRGTDPKLSGKSLSPRSAPPGGDSCCGGVGVLAGALGVSGATGPLLFQGLGHLMIHPVMRCSCCSPLRVAVVIRGVEHSTMHLTRCSPWRVAEWQIVRRAGM